MGKEETKRWYNEEGQLHRKKGPAFEHANGDKEWYLNGKRHRENGPAIEYANGDKIWYLEGKRHREDGPAIEKADGSKEWYIKGKLHREEGPAIEHANGDKFWYLNGELHREDGPAIEHYDKDKYWYLDGQKIDHNVDNFPKVWEELVKKYREKNSMYSNPYIDKYGTKRWYDEKGQFHRENGPAIEYVNGSKYWFIDGKFHREDGPAIERADGSKEWYIKGKLHREDGPAIEHANGDKFWYLDNEKIDYCNKMSKEEKTVNGIYVNKQYITSDGEFWEHLEFANLWQSWLNICPLSIKESDKGKEFGDLLLKFIGDYVKLEKELLNKKD